MGLKCLTSVLINEEQREIRHRRGDGNVTLEVETEVTQPQTKDCWQSPEVGRVKE